MKRILLFICIVLFSGSIFSQTDSTSVKDSTATKKEITPVLKNVSDPVAIKGTPRFLPFSFGPRIGVGITQLYNDDFYGRGWKPVLNAGGVFNYHFNEYFSAGTEIYFTHYAKNYNFTTTSNFFPKMMNNLYAFGIDSFIVDVLLSGINLLSVNDTIYKHTKGTFKMTALEMPLTGSFSFKNFKLTAGAYASLQLSTTTAEEYRESVPFLDLFGPVLDTAINAALGGTGMPGLSLSSFIIDPAVPYYKKPGTSSTGSVTDLAQVTFGYIGDLSYTFSNNVNLGVRINYPWMTYKPNVNVTYVRNTQYAVSVTYLFRIKKSSKGQKAKSLTH